MDSPDFFQHIIHYLPEPSLLLMQTLKIVCFEQKKSSKNSDSLQNTDNNVKATRLVKMYDLVCSTGLLSCILCYCMRGKKQHRPSKDFHVLTVLTVFTGMELHINADRYNNKHININEKHGFIVYENTAVMYSCHMNFIK